MDDKSKKPGLAIILAAAKKSKAGGEGGEDSGGYAPSPECVAAVRHFFEAGSDGDYDGAARALATANEHLESAEGKPEEASPPEME